MMLVGFAGVARSEARARAGTMRLAMVLAVGGWLILFDGNDTRGRKS